MNPGQRLEVPTGEVLIRKIKGSEGPHERVGYSKIGRIYTVGDRWAKRLVDDGEFEYVYPEPTAAESKADAAAGKPGKAAK